MANKLYVSKQAISKWENDKSLPDISLYPTIASLLNITVDELMGNEVNKKKMSKKTDQNARKQELLKLFDQIEDTKGIILPMIDDVVFLEAQLSEKRKLPFIKVHPDFPDIQKPTAAAKQYKELLQQYNNCVKILTGILRKDTPEEESPLRAFIEARKGQLK